MKECRKNNQLWKKEMIPLSNTKSKLYCRQNVCHSCKKEFSAEENDEKYYKVRHHCQYTEKYRNAPHNICNLRCKTSKENPVVLDNA